MSAEDKSPESAPASKGKDIATKARVEMKPDGKDAPKPGTTHSFKNAAGTTVTTKW